MNGENIGGNYSFIKRYTLIQQSPMIHFQHNQDGATLRATEVKPKLDAFLRKKLGEDALRKWFVKDTKALNYKLRFKRITDNPPIRVGYYKDNMGNRHTEYDIFFGNVGGKNIQALKNNVEMTVVCTVTELSALIDSYVGEFFAVSAFGTMSGKGFGCFKVKEKPMTEQAIAEALKNEYGARSCYCFDGGRTPFKQIKTVYSLMKAGINNRGYQRSLLFLFMHEKYGIGNEKAWLKQQRIAPALGKRPDRPMDQRPRYVRALLGTTEKYEFFRVPGDFRNKANIKIKSKEIERCPSPILFRIFDGTVYMVANRIPKEIYGKSFNFFCAPNGGNISVPELSEIGEDFIDNFLEYAVEKIKGGIADKFISADRDNQNNSVRITAL